MTSKRNETTNLSFHTLTISELKQKKELPYPLGVGVRKQSQKRRMIEGLTVDSD